MICFQQSRAFPKLYAISGTQARTSQGVRCLLTEQAALGKGTHWLPIVWSVAIVK